MTLSFSQFFSQLFGNNIILAVILISIIPMIELKGAIPFGTSVDLWGGLALSSWESFAFAFLGSSLIVPILALIFKPIVSWLGKYKFFAKIIHFFTDGIIEKSNKINDAPDKKSVFLKMLTVFLFVAFPVPLTGVWTGTCFAVLLGLSFWQILVSAILGNLVCGLIITGICTIFPNATTILLYVFLGIIVIALLVKLILHFVKKKKSSSQNNQENQNQNLAKENKDLNQTQNQEDILIENQKLEKETENKTENKNNQS